MAGAAEKGRGMDDGLDSAIERCLASSGCPQCGARLRLLRVLCRRTATAVIATHCDGCGAVANRVCFTGDLLRQLHQHLAEPAAAHVPARGEPISGEDVAAMRDYLASSDGAVLELFRSFRRP
jgi:hypothetical protein